MTREHRRRAIVEAAYGLIASAGFEGFRVRTVAEHVGINHATLLHYFPSKEAIVEAVLEHMMEELRQEGYRHGELSAMEAICQEFSDAYTRIVKHPEFFVVLSELQLRAHRDPLIAAPLERMDHAWRRYLTSLLTRGIASGELRADLVVDAVVDVLILQFRGFGFQALDVHTERELEGIIGMECAMLRQWLMAT